MDRRTFTGIAGGSVVLGIAGCLWLKDDSSEDPDDGNGTGPAGNESPQDPEPEPAEDGPSYDFDGNGDFETTVSLEEGMLAVDYQHWGNSHDIDIQAEGAERSRTFLNEYYEDGFDGTVIRYVEGGDYQLIFDASSQWSATVRQPRFSEAEYKSLPAEVDGVDYGYAGPFEFSRGTEVTLSGTNNVGTGSMDLHSLQGDRAAILNNGGGYDTEEYEISATVNRSGPGLLYVDTMGTWTLTITPP